MSGRPAIFLDRDGVVVLERDELAPDFGIKLMPGAAEALAGLKCFEPYFFVVSNQTAVARGILTEEALREQNEFMRQKMMAAGGPDFDGIYYCPHHPEADLAAYRQDCECRKPRPGLILKAVQYFDVDRQKSFMIGDRLTDVMAGHRAGVKTILFKSGHHADPPIMSPALDFSIQPDWECDSWTEIVQVIEGAWS